QQVHLLSAGEGGVVALPIVGDFLKKVYDDGRLGISRHDLFARPAQLPRYDCEEAAAGQHTTADDDFFD
ncbi:MAG: hypothetical protein K2I59_01940, partial [Alistipes sp.]|nr:hypothetical protein [Alistipes sp.]